jgi:hypothetical protein
MYIASEWHDDGMIMQLEGEGKLSLRVSFHCSGINSKHLTETTKILRIVTAPAEIRMVPFPNTGETHCCSSRLAGYDCKVCNI